MDMTPSSENENGGLAVKFLAPGTSNWQEASVSVPAEHENRTELLEERKRALAHLKEVLLGSLQMQHLVVLAGSGTSHGEPVLGPSMWDLWDYCVHANPGAGDHERRLSEIATEIHEKTGYRVDVDGQNIEHLLSRCESYLQFTNDSAIEKFVKDSKAAILQKCSAFIRADDATQLSAHRTFLHRLSRRRIRDSRLKVFTTNYDLCFEIAAAKQGLVVIDGFSFTLPRSFDPRLFGYDIVRRTRVDDEPGNYLEGVFHLYKLHGSVNWARQNNGDVNIDPHPSAESACLIYPARGKYQQSFLQPHIELLSQYLGALREPNTCVVTVGFGFNDDHLSEPILAAVSTNPHLRLIVANSRAQAIITDDVPENRYWKSLKELSRAGSDIWILDTTFRDFSQLIPDLKSLTPAQKLARDIRNLTEH